MTEAEQLKQEVDNLKKQLEESKRMSRVYLQNVAHQLTAPLGAIKWSIEALKDEHVPIQRKGNLLRSVYSQATILVHLIKNFSLMSNLEADEQLGQMRNQEEIDPMLLAINLTNDFQPQAAEQGEKKIEVDNDSFKAALGYRKLKVEKNLIAQALSNLLENAVKYADAESKIVVRAEKDDGIGVSVTSIGLPITEDDKKRIFQRGERGVTAQKRVPAGTGIGLYLASRVMKLHEGTITIGTNGKTSRFTLVFPQSRIT
jgi:signal transduction histidine kinase